MFQDISLAHETVVTVAVAGSHGAGGGNGGGGGEPGGAGGGDDGPSAIEMVTVSVAMPDEILYWPICEPNTDRRRYDE